MRNSQRKRKKRRKRNPNKNRNRNPSQITQARTFQNNPRLNNKFPYRSSSILFDNDNDNILQNKSLCWMLLHILLKHKIQY